MVFNSKAKGGDFERLICKTLSRWVTAGKKEDCFWRSAMSGGRATVSRKKGLDDIRQAGDITAVAAEGIAFTERWYVECKHLKNLNVEGFLFTDAGYLYSFWVDTQRHATSYGRLPLLIAQQNFYPAFVVALPDDLTRYALGGLVNVRWSYRVLNPRYEIWLLDELIRMPFVGTPGEPHMIRRRKISVTE